VTLTGRTALVALVGVIPVALLPGWATLLGWSGALVLGVVLDLALAGSVRAVTIERQPVSAVRLGEAREISLVLTNTGSRRVRGPLRDAWQPSAGASPPRQNIRLEPGTTTRVTTVLRPTRRGHRRAHAVTIRSIGPWGLAARQATVPTPGTLRVLPPFSSRKHLPSKLAQLRELDGSTALRIRGQGTEFDSLRDYVIGDDVRSIDWRATARRQQVVVRTWRPERDRRVLLVLDTSRTSAARIGDEPRLDAAMDAALLIAAVASQAGDRVGFLARDRKERARVTGITGTALLPALMEAMSPLEADLVEADWEATVAAVRRRLTQRTLIVLLTPLEAAAVEEGLLPVVGQLTQRHPVVIASVTDPSVAAMAAGRGDSYSVYGAAAAERAILDRRALTAELIRTGVEVVDAVPERLPPELTDRYLSLKAAGRL
jgi:uncharacterized protein (DUF58 family)